METTDTADRRPGALAGLRVIDAATLAAAPFAATILAEYGAEVIKVEQPGSGDPLRDWGPQKNGVGLMWKSIARNKKTITLDLRQPRGQDILRRLARDSDVLIFNNRPSTLRKWGLTYEELREVNDALIVLHVTGFGDGGPFSDRPGFGTLGEAMSGFAHLTGEPDRPPTLPPFMLADSVASLIGLSGVLTALYHRKVNGGRGQRVDINLIEPLARLLEHAVLTYDQLGVLMSRSGNRWDVSVPRNTYQTADDHWLAMSGSSPTVARRVFVAIGRAELLDDPEFTDPRRRLANAEAIDRMVAEWVAGRTLAEAMAVLTDHDVAAAPVYDTAQLLADPQLAARDSFVRIADEDLGSMTVQGPVARLSETQGCVEHLGRGVGADNAAVYSGLLGLTDIEMADLAATGVI